MLSISDHLLYWWLINEWLFCCWYFTIFNICILILLSRHSLIIFLVPFQQEKPGKASNVRPEVEVEESDEEVISDEAILDSSEDESDSDDSQYSGIGEDEETSEESDGEDEELEWEEEDGDDDEEIPEEEDAVMNEIELSGMESRKEPKDRVGPVVSYCTWKIESNN
jgi:hypothetical protein